MMQKWTNVDLGTPDDLLASEEALKKKGAVGKFISSHRKAVVWAALFLMILGGAAVLALSGFWIYGSFRLIAAGFSYRFGQTHLPVSKVRLAGGQVVENVIQPVALMTSEQHGRLLLLQLRSSSRERSLISREDVARGYMEWQVSEFEQPHNFTLSAAKDLASRSARRLREPCLCYAAMGIAKNIVYVTLEDTVLYEPQVVGEPHNVEKMPIGATHLSTLVDRAKQKEEALKKGDRGGKTKARGKATVSSSGKLLYITESGNNKRKSYSAPVYPCIKTCIELINDAV